MYLIEESIMALQQYFQREPELKDIEEELNCNGDSSAMNSAWQDYEKCHPTISPVMQYGFKTPFQFIEELKKMWGNRLDLTDEEFVKLLVASAFRQTMEEVTVEEKITNTSDVSLPTYIYNF